MIKVVNEYTHIKSIYNFSGNIDGTNLIKYNSNLNPINKEQLLTFHQFRSIITKFQPK